MLRLVGLTGGIASGKTTVSNKLKERGFPVICCDVLARRVVEPGHPCNRQLIKAFGKQYFDDEGNMNRKELGRLVFSSPEKRKALDKITHGHIFRLMLKEIFLNWIRGHKTVVLDIPLFFETRKTFGKLADTAVVVYVNREVQLQRLIARDRLSADSCRKKISSQMDIEEKRNLADIVIDNSGDLANLDCEVEKFVTEFSKWKYAKKAFARNVVLFLFMVLPIVWIVRLFKRKPQRNT